MATRVLCTEDLVYRKGGSPHSVGNIERTHTDVDTHSPRPWQHEAEPILENDSVSPAALRKFKSDGVPPKGTVYVRWVFVERTELIAESQLELLHRSLFIGDIVNRRAEDSLSGVVLNVHTKCSLQPMGKAVVNSNNGSLLSLLPFEHTGDALVRVEDRPPPLEDIPVSELMYEEAFSEDDLVTYKGWLGRVMTMTTALTVRLTDNCVVEVSDEVCELLSDHPDVARAGDIVKTTKGKLRTGVWKFGKYNPNTPPIGSVVSTRATTVEVMWLQHRLVGNEFPSREPPKVLERDELESMDFRVYDRSKRPTNVSQEMTVSYSEIEASISQRVRFRDLTEAAAKYNGSTPHGTLVRIPRQDTLGYDMNVFEIKTVTADVTVQWQDLTVTREKAVELIPDAAIDDLHAAWPGEIAHSLTMKPKSLIDSLYSPEKVGVVQCVKPDERMAMVRWCPAASVTYSKSAANAADPSGLMPQEELVETVVAIADGPTEELSLYDVDCPAALNVRRGDIVLITSPELFSSFAPGPADGSWLGEVVDTWLDGRLLIRLGASDVVEDVAVRREDVAVVVRSDDTHAMDGLPGDEEGMEEDSEMDDDSEENEWLSEDEELQATYVDENGEAMDLDDVENEDWESDEDEDESDLEKGNAMEDATSSAPDQQSSIAPQPTPPVEATLLGEAYAPESYAILETPVPDDHPYRDQPSTSNPTVMKRTQKEHKILQSPGALPGGVYVRTWESRLDLFRVLFVGPEETPYARAPFIMDFCLPTDYPQAPPMAFFHSWLGESGMGGLGRVNPNLYEDGKICLSLLGTWDGDKAEAWNPVKSTLLQVIVSLLGLVLVPEPYFNEAGYEPLAGSASSKRPSALYNERTFLRSSSFLISAVVAVKENTALPGLQGLEDEMRWLYTHPGGPKLLSLALDRVEDVLQRSEKDEKVEPDGATVMSKGACIPLRRVLNRLRTLKD
jgi:ubiquitin-conjugating enzyme E2 O